MLSNVRIEAGDDAVLEWQAALAGLDPEELQGRLVLMLEANPDLFGEYKLTELVSLFGRDRVERPALRIVRDEDGQEPRAA